MKKLVNSNLISLKCVSFTFFAGIGCLFPYLTGHILAVGLPLYETCVICIVAPCIAIFGPLIFGPLADRLSVGRGCETTTNAKAIRIGGSEGNGVLRFLLAACLILAALFYGLLFTVPDLKALPARRPSVIFMCDSSKATVYQEMCAEETCAQWNDEKVGHLLLSNCRYACEKPPIKKLLYVEDESLTEGPELLSEDSNELDFDSSPDVPPEDEEIFNREKRDVSESDVPPPHICYSKDNMELLLCQAYSSNIKQLLLQTSLLPAVKKEYGDENKTQWCAFRLGGHYQCSVPPSLVPSMAAEEENGTCNPIVECDVDDPYDSPKSVLAEAHCKGFIGDLSLTFWSYLTLRSLGDLFTAASLCLFCTACVIATRETSIGRGDVGRQLVFGVIGIAIIPPLVGLLQDGVGKENVPPYFVPIISAICLFIVAALIMICANGMPLSPPEWWWHTKSGMLALPMNTVRRYSIEIGAVFFVLIVLGIFWSTLEVYRAPFVFELHGSDLLLSLTMAVGAIPAIPVLWKAEFLVDYCGHSNIFIGSLTFYIIKYCGTALVNDPWWILFFEAFEVFTLSLMWVAAIFYFRHLIPRKFTSTGQALPIIAHFCIGRCFGAIIGSVINSGPPVKELHELYKIMAGVSGILAIIYLCLYHFVLAPRCRASSTGPPNPVLMQGLNSNGASNGSYTPLRVYHNERGRKGQFRY